MRIGASWQRSGPPLTEAELAEIRRRQERIRRISELSKQMRSSAPHEIVERHWVRPVSSDFVLGSTHITEFDRACFDPRLALRQESEEHAEARGWASQARQREVDSRVDLTCGLSLHESGRRVRLQESGSPTMLAELSDAYLVAPSETSNLVVGQFGGLSQEIDPADGTMFLCVNRKARESKSCRLEQPMPSELSRMTFHDSAEFEHRRYPNDSSRSLNDTYVVKPDGSVRGYEFKQIGDTWGGGRVEVTEVSGQLAPDGSVVTESGHTITPWITHQQLFGERRVSPELEQYYAGEPGERRVIIQEGPRFEIAAEGTAISESSGYVQLPGVQIRKRS